MLATSPCIHLCVMDDASGLCRGCGRTMDEIAAWSSLSEAERHAVMATLEQRRRNAGEVSDRATSGLG